MDERRKEQLRVAAERRFWTKVADSTVPARPEGSLLDIRTPSRKVRHAAYAMGNV